MYGRHNKPAASGETGIAWTSFLISMEKKVGIIETVLNYIGVSFLILLLIMTVAQISMRAFFNTPLPGYIDIMEMTMVPLVFLCLAYCQWQGGHMRVELFMTKVLRGGRSYHLTEVLHLLLSLVAFGIIAFYSSEGALQAYRTGDSTLSIYMPTWPFRMGAAIGSIVLCVRFFVQMMQNLTWAVVGKNKPEPVDV